MPIRLDEKLYNNIGPQHGLLFIYWSDRRLRNTSKNKHRRNKNIKWIYSYYKKNTTIRKQLSEYLINNKMRGIIIKVKTCLKVTDRTS